FHLVICDTTPTEIYPLSLHDALPIFTTVAFTKDWHPFKHSSFIDCGGRYPRHCIKDTHGSKLNKGLINNKTDYIFLKGTKYEYRSEEHTSELQSRENLVCRLLLEKKQ